MIWVRITSQPQKPQTFSTQQLAACARRAGFNVLECEYADGRLSNYPVFLACKYVVHGHTRVIIGKIKHDPLTLGLHPIIHIHSNPAEDPALRGREQVVLIAQKPL